MPLVRGDSEESRRGYHTPASPSPPGSPTSLSTPATPKGFHTPLSEPSAPSTPVRPTLPAPIPPPLTAPTSQGGPPSPSSALMTVSLDAYLEPRRISFESPPSSELLPRAQSPEESYPVFSPPPIRRRHTVASPSLLQRTSIISHSSRAEPNSHHTCNYRDKPIFRRFRLFLNMLNNDTVLKTIMDVLPIWRPTLYGILLMMTAFHRLCKTTDTYFERKCRSLAKKEITC